MKTNTTAPSYKGFRFPPEIISHAIWLYFRFSLSFRHVEELLAQGGIVMTYETVHPTCDPEGKIFRAGTQLIDHMIQQIESSQGVDHLAEKREKS